MSFANSIIWLNEDLEKLLRQDIDPSLEVFETLHEYAQEIHSHVEMLIGEKPNCGPSSPDFSETGYPDLESRWLQRHGQEYEVVGYANIDTTDPEKYPITIIYRGTNGKIWTRPLADWSRSMTPKLCHKGLASTE